MNEIIKENTQSRVNNLGVLANSSLNQPTIKIHGILTKRIELKGKNTKEPYYYSFLKLQDQPTDLPIIFKEKVQPNIPLNSLLELTGYYSNSEQSIRKSFTCLTYQIYQILAPPNLPDTIPKLKEQIQTLLAINYREHNHWHQSKDFLTQKLKDLEELEKFTQQDPVYLQAYLQVKDIHYTNFQPNLPNPHFTLSAYLVRIAKEIEPISQKVQTYQRKYE